MREAILTFLEKNSRIDLQELAVILGTDEVTVANEIAKMEQEHIICGYHTLIDWDKTSADKVTALIEVRVTPQRGQGFDSIAERIYNYPEVRLSDLRRLRPDGDPRRKNPERGFRLRVRQAFHAGFCLKHSDPLYSEKIQRPRNDL